MTQVAAGLGLLPSTVIDQHFAQRNRYGRLLMIVAQSPQLLGLGHRRGHRGDRGQDDVLSRGRSRRGDDLRPGNIATNAYEAKRSAPLLASGVVLHVLPQGARFDLTTRTLLPFEVAVDPLEAAEIEEAGRDLRQMARDIAAGDASPSVLRRRLRRTRKTDSRPGRRRQNDRAAHPRPRRSSRRGSTAAPTSGPTTRRSTSSSTSARWRSSRPTPSPASPTTCSRCCPGLREHSCSRGKRGGFVERLHEGTWLGHVAEHTALALQQVVGHDIRRGKTRAGQGPARPLQRDLRVRRRAGRARGRAARRTPGQPPRPGGPGVRLGRRSSRRSSCAPSGRRSVPRPRRSSTRRSPATSRGSGSTSTPWSSSARASTPSGSAPR